MTSLNDLATAHSEGITFARYYEKDSSIVTAGQDGDIRVYPAIHEDEKFTITTGSKISSLAVFGDNAVIGTLQHEVKTYSLSDTTNLNTILEFTAPVTHVCVTNDNKKIGGASSDFKIKVVDTDGLNQKLFEGHEAPVTCLLFHGEKLLSSSCDGTIKLWNVSNQKIEYSLETLPKTNSYQGIGVMSFHQDTSLLAVPAGKVAKVVHVSDKLEVKYDIPDEHTEGITVCCWSNDGTLLATASKNGELFIWNKLSCVSRFKQHEGKEICSLQWNPSKKNEILFADADGQFGFCEVSDYTDEKNDPSHQDGVNFADFDGDGDIDDDLDISYRKTKRKANEIDDDDENTNDGMVISKKKHRINNMDNFLDDAAEDDDDIDETINDNNISLNLIKEGLLSNINKKSIIEDDDSLGSFITDKKMDKPKEVEVKVSLQPPFQPSSTPAHLTHRFMVWNSVGIVFCHCQDGMSSIAVEFHDANTHHSLNFPNVLNNTMASLSNTLLALACKKDNESSSKLTCHHFASWDSNKEWTLSLSKDEEILALSCNSNFISCASSQQYLRIFSVSGIQVHVSYLPGTVVTLVMSQKKLMVVYHQGSGLNHRQSFGIQHFVYQKGIWKATSNVVFQFRKESTLVWAGYSREGNPTLLDSLGSVFLKNIHANVWTPICDLKSEVKNKSDNYWVIGIEEQSRQIRCIYCKASKCPTTLPRPVPTSVPFKIPLLEATQEKSKLEHEYLVNSMVTSNLKELHSSVQYIDYAELEKQNTELLIRMFALACKADRDFKAVEICRLMSNVETISFAIQYASKQKKFELAKRLDQLAKDRMIEDENDDDDENTSDVVDENDDDDDIDMGSDDDYFMEEEKEKKPISNNSRKLSIKTGQNDRKQNSWLLSGKLSSRPSLETQTIDNTQVDSQMTQTPNTEDGKLQQHGTNSNPFKLKARKSSDVRGTSYFDSMSKENLNSKSGSKTKSPAATTNNSKKSSGTKQVMLNAKMMTSSVKSRTKEESKENIEAKPSKKKTGFQLFLEHLKENASTEEQSSDDFVMSCTSKWKQLSKEEKQKWNTKDQGGDMKQVKVASKNKLNSFAFSK